MATRVLNRIVFVKDPTALPEGVPHTNAVVALAAINQFVVLLSHGNKYDFPSDWIPPYNSALIEYDVSSVSDIEEKTRVLHELLKKQGVVLHSRWLDKDYALPMLLSGACLSHRDGMQVAFLNNSTHYQTNQQTETDVDSDWQLLD